MQAGWTDQNEIASQKTGPLRAIDGGKSRVAWHSPCPMSGAFETGTRAKCPFSKGVTPFALPAGGTLELSARRYLRLSRQLRLRLVPPRIIVRPPRAAAWDKKRQCDSATQSHRGKTGLSDAPILVCVLELARRGPRPPPTALPRAQPPQDPAQRAKLQGAIAKAQRHAAIPVKRPPPSAKRAPRTCG